MKENDPKYTLNKRTNKRIATRCRVCGGPLLSASDIKNEIHEECNNDNKNVYMR